MGMNVLTREIRIDFNDVTDQLDGVYGLVYLVELHLKCMGQWQVAWASGVLQEQTDWVGGIIVATPQGLDPHTKWWVNIAPIGNDGCRFSTGVPCEVYADPIYRSFDWGQNQAWITIPWKVKALA